MSAQSPQIKKRNIDFNAKSDAELAGKSTPQTPPPENPYDHGLWMKQVQIPQVKIAFADAAKRKESVAIYRSFCLELLKAHNRNLGFVRYCLGVVLNRLKPIKGKGKKIHHGEWAKLLKDLGISEDLAEEVRWADEALTRKQAETIGWKEMREKALEARAGKNGKGKGKRKGSLVSMFTGPEKKLTFTPQTCAAFFAKTNKTLTERLDAKWMPGNLTKKDSKKELQNAANAVVAIEGKCKTFRQQIHARLAELKK